MTMLDRMRRRRHLLKWSLLVVVATFVVLYIPSFMDNGGIPGVAGAQSDEVFATVDGEKLTAGEYRRIYLQQVQQMRQAYGGSLDDNMLKQLGVPQRIIQQMVDEEAIVTEARRRGLRVTDAELRERIVRMPGFQQNGQFVGSEMYTQILQMQRPPLRVSEFEEQFRKSLLAEKLQAAVTGWVRVSDADAEAEYRKRNEKVKLDLAVFTANQFRAGITPTDAEISAQFSAHTDTYKLPEKRRVKYVLIDAQQLKNKVTVTPAEVQAQYQQNLQNYSTPEQIRASHILLKTEGKDDAAVKKAIEGVLAEAKAGKDFAALAKKYSEDDSNKDKGGDLDFFGRGVMDKAFEDAAFALKPGELSPVVKSQFGYHIIKAGEKRAASTRTLDEMKGQIEEQLKQSRAQDQAASLAAQAGAEIKDITDFEKVGRARGLQVGDSGLFSREEPLAGIGFAPAVTAEAFSMQQGKVSGQLRTSQGFAFIALEEIKPPATPKLEEVKDKVREDVIRLKAVELARAKADVVAQAAAKGSFAAAAKAAGVTVKNTDFIGRGTALPDVGTSAAIDDAVFKLKAGESTGAIATDNAVVVAYVKERQDIKAESLAADKDQVRDELLQQRRQEFFASYMLKAKEKMKIEYRNETIRTMLGS